MANKVSRRSFMRSALGPAMAPIAAAVGVKPALSWTAYDDDDIVMKASTAMHKTEVLYWHIFNHPEFGMCATECTIAEYEEFQHTAHGRVESGRFRLRSLTESIIKPEEQNNGS